MPLSRIISYLNDSALPGSPDILPTPGGQESARCRTQTGDIAAMSVQTEMTWRTPALASSDLYFSQEENTDKSTNCTACPSRDHWMTLAPWVRCIPPEILIQILLHCLDANKKSPPWYLSHVCRLWRDITLRTPQLWTRIPLPPLSNRVRAADALVCFMPEYLARSKDQPINFSWEGNWDPESLEEEDQFEDPLCGHSNVILDLLIQHAERWGKVSLISGRWTPKFEHQLTQLRSRLARLYHLELRISGSQIMYDNAFQDTPCLTNVKLCTYLAPNSPELAHDFIHWEQIERLKFTIPSTCILLQLGLCRNLVELDLEYAGEEAAIFGPDKLELPHLKAFSLRSPSDLSSNHFELVSFPRLEDFRVFLILAEPEPFCSFLRFLDRHRTSLRRLTIGHIHFMYFQTSRPETRIDFTSLPFAQLQYLGYLQLHRPPLDKLSAFLKAIARGSIPLFTLHTLHIIFSETARLPHAYITDLSDQLNAVVLWSERARNTGSSGSSCIRRIIINPGDLNDFWEFLTTLEGWPEEYDTAPSETGKAFVSLRECERRLQEVYGWDYDFADRVISANFDEEATGKIAECLEVMESGVDQVCLLYSTRIHFIVRALGNLSSDQLTPAKDTIPERSLALVDEWRPLFLEDMKNRRWMHRGSKRLIYVPGNDELYRPIVEHWMYGLKPEWETEDLDDLF